MTHHRKAILLFIYLLMATGCHADLPMNAHFIAPPQTTDYHQYLAQLHDYRDAATKNLDLSVYQREDLAWTSNIYTCHFTFMFDSSFYDPVQGAYRLDAFLDEGDREFGGYDAITLWQGYPRLGVDDRNQFDMYRDMPGGLDGLAQLVARAHQRHVKVFIDYNPWDTATRREPCSDEAALAELVAAIGADGIFLDTQVTASPTLRPTIDQARPGVAFIPEHHPAIDMLGTCSASWAQWLDDPQPPGLLHLKWLQPRHQQFQIRRWDRSRRDQIETAFFNASGMMIWENIFGGYNPWPAEDRRLWQRAVRILRCLTDLFHTDDWQPFYPTAHDNLYAHRWSKDDVTVYTLRNLGKPLQNTCLLKLPHRPNIAYVDLWQGKELTAAITTDIDRLSAILEIPRDHITPKIQQLLHHQRQECQVDETRNRAHSVVTSQQPQRTPPASRAAPPPGMVYIPQTSYVMKIQHIHRECGCHPDPQTPREDWPDFLISNTRFEQTIRHEIPVDVAPFFIDETEVTNAQFAAFLKATAYRPRHTRNFLKHWPHGTMPDQLADHPVVYVDLDDARAYAKWAGKRLPREEEWQLAAQGPDAYRWPWGNEFAPNRCNTTGATAPVRSHPQGRSPHGCYHMAGNVWEWTESFRDDGHTRFSLLRGGSFYHAQGSVWYVDGGPQPCNHHAKFIHMWPGLDRCATIGFRCVKDIQKR